MSQKRFYSRFRLALLGAAVILLVTPSVAQAVTAVLLTTILVAFWFYGALGARSRSAPIAEIGSWFVAAVTAYTVIPLLIYLALGQRYTILNDNRLMVIQPEPAQVAVTGLLYLSFLIPFAVIYVIVRGRAEPPQPVVAAVTRQTVGVLAGMWVLLVLLSALAIPNLTADTYEGGYAAVAALPLGIRQILRLWAGWSVVLTIAVRVWLFQDFDRRKWIIALWIAYDLFFGLMSYGSRTPLALSLASCFLLYHLFVRPVRARTAFLAAGVALFGFLILGVLRSAQNLGAAAASLSGSGGEFEALFGNAIDLQLRVANGEVGSLPLSFHLADILAVFPSQVLPFVKIDQANWYIGTFYPSFAERGFGFAFGVIAQGIVGFGWIDLLLRGAILGYVFARLHRYFSRNSHRFWVVVAYVWLTGIAYQSFRNQSFILVSIFVQQFLSLVLVTEGLKRLLRHGKKAEPNAGPLMTPLAGS